MRQFLALFKRDISIFYKSKSIFILAIIFFLLVTVMLPIGIGPDLKILRSISPGLVWIAFLLSTLLNMPLLFTDDFKDGSLDVIIIESDNPILSILSKILSFWTAVILPIILFIPIAGVMLNLGFDQTSEIIILLLISSPYIILVSAIGSAITIKTINSGLLITSLITPFYIPILIIGTLPFINNDFINFDFVRSAMLLTAASLLSMVILPYFIIYILSINTE
ncbi:MAG: heme exporter protein CcmB [Rhodobiaceae bacterium]|nr:heme exporter protein CcmB [Rhodobiaceae bacterium]|tara:strand:- start:50302 stop:50970 length:669 start_codon:yes stop_codon:yes gene_type:complete